MLPVRRKGGGVCSWEGERGEEHSGEGNQNQDPFFFSPVEAHNEYAWLAHKSPQGRLVIILRLTVQQISLPNTRPRPTQGLLYKNIKLKSRNTNEMVLNGKCE